MTLNQLKNRAKASGLMIRKDGNGGYILTDLDNRAVAPAPMTFDELEKWISETDTQQ